MQIHCEWGQPALRRFDRVDTVVVVDVLSFGSSVDVALSRGAQVIPHDDHMEPIASLARSRGAHAAGARGTAGFNVSPSSLLELEPGSKLVLPTSNLGSLRLRATKARVVAACFRNRRAVAEALHGLEGELAVVPIGELWPEDGGWRFALEDWLCAGALLEALGAGASVEARAAVAAWRQLGDELHETLRESRSGRRLVKQGFDRDVRLAAELDVSRTVPVLSEGSFVDASSSPSDDRATRG